MDIKEFLQRDNIQQLLYEERLEEVYEKWYGDKNTLTKFFIQNEINPLEYIDRIVPDMFENMDLKHIVIPHTVTSIGNYAFYNCSNLTSITIPDGITSIGSSAFQKCDSLTSVTIPDSVTSIGGYAFDGCYSLTSITIPEDIAEIKPNTFKGCSSMKEITIKGHYTKLPEDSFFTSGNVKIRCYEGSAAHVFVTDLDLYHEVI